MAGVSLYVRTHTGLVFQFTLGHIQGWYSTLRKDTYRAGIPLYVRTHAGLVFHFTLGHI